MSVTTNFETFCNNLLITQTKRSTISDRYLAICKRLNKDFWGMDTTSGGRYVGSFGRNTANSYVSDIDMLFEMPLSTYNTYNAYISNGQSALLQAVKNSIATTYPNTSLRGDGQIVQVTFSDSMKFEVLPAFKNDDGSYTYANSNNGGSWKKTNPVPEISAVSCGDGLTNNNLRPLCRMARAWKYYNSVPISGLLIDTLAHRFLTAWSNRDKSYLYYDFMSRDFFSYLKNQDANQNTWYAIGSGQSIYNPDNFRYKATVAYNKSLEAIQQETDNFTWSAKQKWREIYGNRFPE
ncbi:SMODS domain-containing nucleotidyltransferase [Confluentibacter lentus]|uniref:SMODS domain-containing nucleotidyltransferase n=1 Tax=Confluentibacter lentus TaxID=1699412 RepID=UPI000C288551|nr:nucleotidyltransferase [Confluentibacter lentus]